METIRIKILKTLTIAAVVVFILSGCALDSDSYIPHIACLISEIWLCLIVWANYTGETQKRTGGKQRWIKCF